MKNQKIWLSVAILIIIGVGLYFGMPYLKVWFLGHNGVGSIDRNLVNNAPQYKAIQEELEKFIKLKEQEFNQKYAKANTVIQEMAYERSREEIAAKRAQLVNPFLNKVENAIAAVAKQKGLNVVLDNAVVICGVQDITADVLNLIKSDKPIPPAKDTKLPASLIAYFDQEVVRSLKIFNDADAKMAKIVEAAQKDIQSKAKKLSADKRNALLQEYQALIERQQEALLSPLYSRVTQTVEAIAKEEGLSLVVNKDDVMYGGKNITDEVVNKLLGK